MAFPGIGQRISGRMKEVGYWRHDRPDVARFCEEKGYRPQYVYAWLKDRMPTYENLDRLAVDLGVSPTWIVFGEQIQTDIRDRALAGCGGDRPVAPLAEPHPSVLAHRRIGPAPRGSELRPTTAARPLPGIDFAPLRQSAEELIELQAQLDAVFQAFPDVYFWIDAAGIVLAYKAGQRAAAPFDEDEVVGRRITDVFPADFAPALERAFREVLKTRAPSALERAIVIGEDPHDYEARLLPLAKASGRALEVLMIVRDVTDLKRREQALVEQETRYRTLVEDWPTGLCVHRDFRIQFANRAMARLFGYTGPEQLTGFDIRELILRHDRPAFEHLHTEAAQGQAAARRTYRCQRQDGETMWVSLVLSSSRWVDEACAFITMFEAPSPRPGATREESSWR